MVLERKVGTYIYTYLAESGPIPVTFSVAPISKME